MNGLMYQVVTSAEVIELDVQAIEWDEESFSVTVRLPGRELVFAYMEDCETDQLGVDVTDDDGFKFYLGGESTIDALVTRVAKKLMSSGYRQSKDYLARARASYQFPEWSELPL